MAEKLEELDFKQVIYFYDIDPDTGMISQMKAVAYVEGEGYAKVLCDFLNKEDGECRTYKFQRL